MSGRSFSFEGGAMGGELHIPEMFWTVVHDALQRIVGG